MREWLAPIERNEATRIGPLVWAACAASRTGRVYRVRSSRISSECSSAQAGQRSDCSPQHGDGASDPIGVADQAPDRHLLIMCGRVIQSSGPLHYGIVEGMDSRDNRVHNYPPGWNGAPSQDLLVIRRNHDTNVVSHDSLRWV